MQPVNQVIPIEKTEEVRERRAAVLMVTRDMLARILMLPDHVTVGAVHYDWQQDAFGMRLDSKKFPLVEDGRMLMRLHPIYEQTIRENGDIIVSMRNLQGEDGVDYAS